VILFRQKFVVTGDSGLILRMPLGQLMAATSTVHLLPESVLSIETGKVLSPRTVSLAVDLIGSASDAQVYQDALEREDPYWKILSCRCWLPLV
jgi:hypothetical protein